MSKKKEQAETVEVNVKIPPDNILNVYDAKVIRTAKGPGMLVETRLLDGAEVFSMTHLGTAQQFPLSLDAAKALRVLLHEWIEARETGWSLAT